MSGRGAERIEPGDDTPGTQSSPLGAEALRTLAVFAVVTAVVWVAADRFDPGTARREAAVVVVHGPASVRGQVALLADGPDELHVTVESARRLHDDRVLLLRGAKFVVCGRPQCVRTHGDTAIVGITWTARDLLGADQPTKGAGILTFLTRGTRFRGRYPTSASGGGFPIAP